MVSLAPYMSASAFIFNICLIILLLTSAGVAVGRSFFDGRPGLCKWLASICVVSCVSSLMSIGVISFNRYTYICLHDTLHPKMFTRKNSLLLCFLTWVIGILLDLPSHVGWSTHAFDTKSKKCIFDRRESHSYNLFFCIGGIFIPCVCFAFCYFKIFFRISQTQQRLFQNDHHNSCKFKEKWRKCMRQSQMMCLIFIAFTICWTPYALIVIIDKHDSMSLELHLYFTLLAHSHASLNCILYGAANKNYRNAYSNFIKYVTSCNCVDSRKIDHQEHVMSTSEPFSNRTVDVTKRLGSSPNYSKTLHGMHIDQEHDDHATV